jgi:hypothetical protein
MGKAEGGKVAKGAWEEGWVRDMEHVSSGRYLSEYLNLHITPLLSSSVKLYTLSHSVSLKPPSSYISPIM